MLFKARNHKQPVNAGWWSTHVIKCNIPVGWGVYQLARLPRKDVLSLNPRLLIRAIGCASLSVQTHIMVDSQFTSYNSRANKCEVNNSPCKNQVRYNSLHMHIACLDTCQRCLKSSVAISHHSITIQSFNWELASPQMEGLQSRAHRDLHNYQETGRALISYKKWFLPLSALYMSAYLQLDYSGSACLLFLFVLFLKAIEKVCHDGIHSSTLLGVWWSQKLLYSPITVITIM